MPSWEDGFLLLAVATIPLLLLEILKQLRHSLMPNTLAVEVSHSGLTQSFSTIWQLLRSAMNKFIIINASQTAGAFANFAFFSLFPLILLFVSLASTFIDREQAGLIVINYVKSYIPIGGEMQNYLFNTVTQVVKDSAPASIVAFLALVWSAMQFFTTLINATNQAWDDDSAKWWRLPLKSLIFLAMMVGMVLVGVSMPVLLEMLLGVLFPGQDFSAWLNPLLGRLVSLLVVFLSLSLFYRYAPSRLTRFREVWVAALVSTLFLQAASALFVIYLMHFAGLNAVYGAFGGIMALLLWIYVSGCIFIFGACLCSAQVPSDTSLAQINKVRQRLPDEKSLISLRPVMVIHPNN